MANSTVSNPPLRGFSSKSINPILDQKLSSINRYFDDLNQENNYQTIILGRVAKVVEEFGELVNEILSSINLQAQRKLDKYDKQHLEEEYADTLLALFLLGNRLGIDIDKVFSAKLNQKLKDFGINST